MKVSEIMNPGLELVSPDTTLDRAAEMMRDDDIGALPVGENDRMLGMVTDRDIVVRALADGRDPRQTTVRTIMTPDVLCVFEDQDVEEAARIMAERQIRRVAVVDRQRRPRGMLSLGDLSRRASDKRLGAETLEQVSHPSAQSRA